MTFTLLNRVVTKAVPNTGVVTLTLTPDAGQFWAPLMLRVSVTSSANQTATQPSSHCTVYLGSPGVPTNDSQYIDDTSLGNGDVTSILSGVTISYGKAIIVTFTSAAPFGLATVTLDGLVSDLPPNLDIPPAIPGVRFAGRPNLVQSNLFGAQNTVVNAAQTVDIDGTNGIDAIDVRGYESYAITCDALTNGVATAFNLGRIDIFWWDVVQRDFPLWHETAQWWADAFGGGFAIGPNGALLLQGPMHGPFMSVQYTNQAAADQIDIQSEIMLSSREVRQEYAKQFFDTTRTGSSDNIYAVPLTVLGAGVPLVVLPVPYMYGNYFLLLRAGAGGATFVVSQGSLPQVDGGLVVAANTTVRTSRIAGKRAQKIQVSNGGVATTYGVEVVFDDSQTYG